MKNAKYYIISAILFVAAIMSIWSGIRLKNDAVSSNRYGSIEAYENDVFYYANNNIYRYNGKDEPEIYRKNVGFHFLIENDVIYYQKGTTVYGINLINGETEFQYTTDRKGFRDMFINGIVGTTLLVEIYYKNSFGQEPKYNSEYIYLNTTDGTIAENMNKDKWEKLISEKEEKEKSENEKDREGYKKVVSGTIATALTENDILYARWPGGTPYISSYRLVRSEDGAISNVEVLEEIVPCSEIADMVIHALYLSGVLLLIAAVVMIFVRNNRSKRM